MLYFLSVMKIGDFSEISAFGSNFMKFRRTFTALALSVLFVCAAAAKDSDSVAFTKKLGLGYNWGNTMEAWGTGGTLEIGWGAPVSTKEMFEDLKSKGITTIRLPVAWSVRMDKNNKIWDVLDNRVNEIVDYAIGSGMYVILNIHWDGGWINDPKTGFTKNWAACMKKYVDIWTQICSRYADYDEHLIFESLNEEGSFDNIWNKYTNQGNKKTAFEILNRINQQFVNTVRESGGKNSSRYLLIAGYGTDIDMTCQPEFKMPADKKKRCMISVHYYTPSTFAILTEDASWGKNRRTWGSDADIAELKKNMAKMKVNFQDKGIGVIVGEYGCPVVNKEPESVRKYLTETATVAYDLGFCPVLWGGSVDIYNRRELKFDDPEIGEMYKALSQKPRN